MTPPRPKILVTRRLPPAVEARIGRDYDATFNPEDRVYTPDRLVAASAGKDGLLVAAGDAVGAEVVERLDQGVGIIATFSVGFEHIGIEAAKRRGIVVTNTPEVLTDATADMALVLLLAAARRVGEGERLVRADKWTGWTPTQLMGVQVTGKRLGIFGMGRIGRAVARRARAFGMEIHYHDVARLPAEIEGGAVFHAHVEDMLPLCQFLTLHCPLNDQTRKFLNRAHIARLPDGAVVVNTSRGPVVDDEALIAALRSGKVAAAGLDVYDGEPRVHPGYLALETVILSPHLGSATLETRNAMGFRALDNLDAFFAGRAPKDRVA